MSAFYITLEVKVLSWEKIEAREGLEVWGVCSLKWSSQGKPHGEGDVQESPEGGEEGARGEGTAGAKALSLKST